MDKIQVKVVADAIYDFLDGMRIEFHCVGHVRQFNQQTLCKELAERILENRSRPKRWPIEDDDNVQEIRENIPPISSDE